MLRYYFSSLFWAAVILFLSSIPSSELPDFSFWKLLSFDKWAHVAMYGILSFQIMKSCVRQYAVWTLRYNAAKVAAVASIIYGGLIELFQEYVLLDRHGDWIDLIMNIIGTFAGIWLFKKLFIQYIR
jgi:VanZ family protein